VAIENRQLRTADVVVMQDGLRRARDDSKVVAFQHRFGEVAAVG
jgi:hypothetical protein